MADYIANPEKERTFRIAITALKSNPAYLTLFCLGLMGGPVVAGAVFKNDTTVAIVATVSWILFLIASIFVVAFVESRRSRAQVSPFLPSDQMAEKTFLESQDAERISGRWHVFWYEGIGKDRKAYAPNPKGTAIISTNGSSIFIHLYDLSTESEYWLFGRMSNKLDVPLIYWSKPETNMLTGIVFLGIDDSFDSKSEIMTGQWQGRTRDGKISIGEVEFVKFGHKSKGNMNK